MSKVAKKYPYAVIATDVVIFTVDNGELKVLLMGMQKAPFSGTKAMPGGLVKPGESVDTAARRILLEQTTLSDVYMEQLYTFGRVDRDPFGRVVSVAYMALLPDAKEVKANSSYSDIGWVSVKNIPKLAYDHKEILQTAVERLKNKLAYTNVAFSLLPNKFTLTQLQTVYEIILGTKLDKRNFRKKILQLGMLKLDRGINQDGKGRPASMYEFKSRKAQNIELI
jgi:8-oxo-dGTP diphosphatase